MTSLRVTRGEVMRMTLAFDGISPAISTFSRISGKLYEEARRARATRVQTMSDASTWLKEPEDPAWVHAYDPMTVRLDCSRPAPSDRAGREHPKRSRDFENMTRRTALRLVALVIVACYVVPYLVIGGIGGWYASFLFWTLAGIAVIALNAAATKGFGGDGK